jgi:hypothetical protein
MAFCAARSPPCAVPVCVPGGNPVIEVKVPADTPISPPALPLITLGPVLVIAEWAKTAKLRAAPRGSVGAATLTAGDISMNNNGSVSSAAVNLILVSVLTGLSLPHSVPSSIHEMGQASVVALRAMR